MKNRLIIIFTIIVISLLTAAIFHLPLIESERDPPDFFLGITADGDLAQTKFLIDNTKHLFDLIVINNPEVVKNKAALNQACDYAYNSGLYFYVHMNHPTYWEYDYNPYEWIQQAERKYETQFMGIYYYDEPGGNQIDLGDGRMFDETSFTPKYDRDAANSYVYYLYIILRDFIKTNQIVTSDYALFWYVYEAGYDAVFSEFAKNTIPELEIAQNRGAATLHNKTWGTIITWQHDTPPYLPEPETLLKQLKTSYRTGAKYILVFNHPQETPFGLVTQSHLEAIQEFKEYAARNPQNKTSNTQKIAYVLPPNIGIGLTDPQDRQWGIWPPGNQTAQIWNDLQAMIKQYGYDFDIIVDSPWARIFAREHYNKLINYDDI